MKSLSNDHGNGLNCLKESRVVRRREGFMKRVQMLFWLTAAPFGLIGSARGGTVNLADGIPGTFVSGQSFNETRGVDVTVMSLSNRSLSAMTLEELNISTPSATVRARIYDSNPAFLIAAGEVPVSMGSHLAVTVPISATLVSGKSYRLCFFVDAGGSGGSAALFDPAPSSVGGFPYTDQSGELRVNQAYSSASDAFPTGANIFVPEIKFELCPLPSSMDLISGTSVGLLTAQGFNGTRGVEVTVKPACGNLLVGSMTLSVLSIASPSATVGARIYDSNTTALIASVSTTVLTGTALSVSVPISVVLASGGHYRLCFFVNAGSLGASANLADPSPPGPGGFPYTDASSALVIDQAYAFGSDAFPTNLDAGVPLIRIGTFQPRPPTLGFCFGDGADPGHATHCPCGNNGAAGNGCANSVNPSGANLSASGASSPDTIVLSGSGMPATATCTYLQGDALDDVVFGDGVRCAGGTLIRLSTKTNAGGMSKFPSAGDLSVSTRGVVTPGSGAVRYYQAQYRNAAATFCPPATINITNGLRIIW